MLRVAPRPAILTGSFTLKADAKWKYIDILPDKSQLTSEAQGELPSQTQLNKLTAVHPGVGADASAASAYINNTDSVFLVEDIKHRVVTVFTATNIPPQRNVIVFDDFVTTGQTLVSMQNLLISHGKNAIFFAGINNKL